MSTLIWWERRLLAGCIFEDLSKFDKEIDYKVDSFTSPSWPKSVARKAIYRDYYDWCKGKGIVPDTERMFFTVLAPFMYLGKKRHVNHRMWQEVHTRGKWVKVRVSRYFAILAPLPVHKARFNERTGLQLT